MDIEKSFKVSYEGGGHTSGAEVNAMDVKSGEKIILPPCSYKKEENIFIGWKTGEDIYYTADSFSVLGDTAFTAVWAKKIDLVSLKERFDKNGNVFDNLHKGRLKLSVCNNIKQTSDLISADIGVVCELSFALDIGVNIGEVLEFDKDCASEFVYRMAEKGIKYYFDRFTGWVSSFVTVGYALNYGLTTVDGNYYTKSETVFMGSNGGNEHILESATHIGDFAFLNRLDLTEFIIPNTVRVLGCYSFSGSGIKKINIGDNVVKIMSNAFSFCNALEEVTVGDGIEGLEPYVFYSCQELAKVSLPERLTRIGQRAFYCDRKLEKIALPKNIDLIEDGAFGCCCRLREVGIPERVQLIANDAFYDCSGLESISLPVGVKSIGDEAFAGCKKLKLKLNDGVTTIGNGAFKGCLGLTELLIPESVTAIGGEAFSGCSGLKELTIPANVEFIGAKFTAKVKGLVINCREQLSGWDKSWLDEKDGQTVNYGYAPL